MASIRHLKREIEYVGADLFDAAFYLRGIVKPEHIKDVDLILNRILEWIDECILRAGHPDGKDNPQLVRAYYRNLRARMANQVDEMFAEMNKISADSGK